MERSAPPYCRHHDELGRTASPSSAPVSPAPRWPFSCCAQAAPPLAAALRIVLVDPRAGDRRGRGLRDARLSLSAQCRRRPDVARWREARRFPRLPARARASTPPPATIYRARCMATTCARVSPKRAPARAANVECVHHRASALQLRRAMTAAGRCGSTTAAHWRADDVVLALGNPPPATLPELAALVDNERYIRDPWSIGGSRTRTSAACCSWAADSP